MKNVHNLIIDMSNKKEIIKKKKKTDKKEKINKNSIIIKDCKSKCVKKVNEKHEDFKKGIILKDLKRYDDKLFPTFKKISLPKRIYKRLELLSKSLDINDNINSNKNTIGKKIDKKIDKKKKSNDVNVFENIFDSSTISDNFKNIDLNINIIGGDGTCKSLLLDCFLFDKFKIRQNDIIGSTNNKFIKIKDNIFIIKLPTKKEDILSLREDIMEISESKGIFKCGKLMIIKKIDIYPEIIKTLISYISEKYINNIKFITTSNSINSLPKKMISLSHNVLIPKMKDDEFVIYYKRLGNKYNTSLVNSKVALKIYKSNNKNLKQTINIISSIIEGRKTDPKYKPSYNIIKSLAVAILNKLDFSNTNCIDEFRNILYEVLMLGLNYRELIKTTLKLIITSKDISNDAKFKIVEAGSNVDNEIIKGQNREFYAIEKFYFIVYTSMNKK